MQVKFIQTQDQYKQALSELKSINKLCLDTETTGLQASLARCRLLQLCDASPTLEDRTVYVFDLFKVPVDDEMKQYVETRELLVIHNANFDFHSQQLQWNQFADEDTFHPIMIFLNPRIGTAIHF